jgi:hypothetical protein
MTAYRKSPEDPEDVEPFVELCSNCHFFELIGYGGNHAGKCLRHAPTASTVQARYEPDDVTARWPVVALRHWCGDYVWYGEYAGGRRESEEVNRG